MAERRLIAHLDMDAFYASVELLRYPELRGRPLVIGGSRAGAARTAASGAVRWPLLREYTGRGVVTTATYEARAFGVHSGMGLMKAAALAPDALLLPADFDEYRRHSRNFKAAVRELAPIVEDRGIDEIYIDLSDLPGVHEDGGRRMGRALIDAVHAATGLSCSVGITPNKLLSKLCSDLEKPRGLTLLALEELPARIWPLAANKVNGIGPKASAKLAALGIATIGDLARAEPDWLVEHFGRSFGRWLHEAAHGRDDRPVVTSRDAKSLSRETTFERDLHAVRDRAALTEILTRLCLRVADDLERKACVARNIAVKLRFDDFSIVTRALALDAPTADARTIRHAAGQCLKRVDLSRRLRLIGVRAGTLAPAVAASLPSEGGGALPGGRRRAAAASLPLPFDHAEPPA